MTSKIIVIDDDPTGSQTVHSCPLLTRWTPGVLEAGLDDPSPLFFILSNTRALAPQRAAEVTRQICSNLREVLRARGQSALFVSRSDSTLRGHYPVETDVIAEELGPFDAHFLVPAFFEGGRVTIDGVHYIREQGRLVRTDTTEFAKDSVFGYSTSYLPDYVEEKTHGRIGALQVLRLPVQQSAADYLDRLMSLQGDRCVAVDSTNYDELGRFARAMLEAIAKGKRFYLRSAASVVSALAALPSQPVQPVEMWRLKRSSAPGVVVVGSHVRRSTEQLNELLQLAGVVGIELRVGLLPEAADTVVREILEVVSSTHAAGNTAVVYTTRRERSFPTPEERLRFGACVSNSLVEVVRGLPHTTSYLVCKGGITSNDVLSTALDVPVYRVMGQIIPGCTLVTVPAPHRLADLPVVIFPGNVGGPTSLVEVCTLLDGVAG